MDGNIANNLPVGGGQALHSGVVQPSHQQAATGGQSQQCRLKVEDALSYLELVKLKYESKPQVYNEFLEVMKDFKSQSINTQGVIQRVSQLFQENVDLILGFNTFLPPEYRIEINPNTEAITLHQPSSAGMQQIAITPGNVNRLNANNQQTSGSNFASAPNRLAASGSHATVPISLSATGAEQSSASGSVAAHHGAAPGIGVHPGTIHSGLHFGAQAQGSQLASGGAQQQSGMTHLVAASIQPAALPGLGGRSAAAVQPGAGGSQQQPVEFDHAISYVNKIKHRFANQPDIYKMFLDILHTYQKEQRVLREAGLSAFAPGHRPLSEAEVYQKVAHLFRGQEDLLQEFGQFLPDTNALAQHAAHGAALIAASARHEEASLGGLHVQPASGLPQQPLLPGSHLGVAHNVQLDAGAAQNASNLQPGLISVGRYGAVGAAPNATAAPQRYGTASIGNAYQAQQLGVAGQTGRGVALGAQPTGGPGSAQRLSGLSFLGNVAAQSAAGGDQGLGASGGGGLSDLHGGGIRDPALMLFEQMRAALRPLGAWDDFVRCLKLFNDEVVGRADLLMLVNRALSRHPELSRQFTDFLDTSVKSHATGAMHSGAAAGSDDDDEQSEEEEEEQDGEEEGDGESEGGENAIEDGNYRASGGRAARERAAGGSQRQAALVRLDYASMAPCGVSYRALPSDYPRYRCSGRSNAAYAHAEEVLNDVWVSLPAWSEGDSQAGSNRKTQFEELLYRLEDERYELDAVIQLNTDTLRLFDYVLAKLNRMTADERSRFRLTEYLTQNEHSSVLYRRAIERLYGDKAHEVIDMLRRTPSVVLPVVIARLRQKDEEWREAQRQFNRLWREQQARYALRALDVQGATIKQNDLKRFRMKSLLNDIERAYEEHEKLRRRSLKTTENADRDGPANSKASQTRVNTEADAEAHLTMYYAREKRVFEDACSLIIHNVKRQITCQKEEKSKMKYIVKQVLQMMLFQTPFELSDDEEQQSSDEDFEASTAKAAASSADKQQTADESAADPSTSTSTSTAQTLTGAADPDVNMTEQQASSNVQTQTEASASANLSPNVRVFYCNLLWYAFLRMHQILCERLSLIWQHTRTLVEQYEAEERTETNIRAAASRQSDASAGAQNQQVAAVALRLRAQRSVNPRGFYDNFLELVRNVLDGEIDNQQFEDELRELYTTKAHYAYTVDKIIQNAVRHLQLIAQHDGSYKMQKLFVAEQRRLARAAAAGPASSSSAGSATADATSYQDRVQQFILDQGPCYRVCFIRPDSTEPEPADTPVTENNGAPARAKRDPLNGVKITFELLESPDDSESTSSDNDEKDEDGANDKDKRDDADEAAPPDAKKQRGAGNGNSNGETGGTNANGAASSPSDTSEHGEAEGDEQMDMTTNERTAKAPKRKRKAPAQAESDSDRDAQPAQAKMRAVAKDDWSGNTDLVKREANYRLTGFEQVSCQEVSVELQVRPKLAARFTALRSWPAFVDRYAFDDLDLEDISACRARMRAKNKPRMLLGNLRNHLRQHVHIENETEDGDALYAKLAHTATGALVIDRAETSDSSAITENRLILLVHRRRSVGSSPTAGVGVDVGVRSALRYNVATVGYALISAG